MYVNMYMFTVFLKENKLFNKETAGNIHCNRKTTGDTFRVNTYMYNTHHLQIENNNLIQKEISYLYAFSSLLHVLSERISFTDNFTKQLYHF